jgi:hypothetical protein
MKPPPVACDLEALMTRPSRLIPYEYAPPQRSGIVFASKNPGADTPGDVRNVFAPGSETFARIHHLPPPIPVNNGHKEEARRQLIEGVRNAPGPLAAVAYFGHGLIDGLVGTGLGMTEAPDFADAIRGRVDRVRGTRVIFYACSTGGLGGFAERLADLLRGRNVTVYGHDGPGPAMTRPYVRCFPGGDWVVAPGDPLFRAWSAALRDSDLWAHFPFMTNEQLRARLT